MRYSKHYRHQHANGKSTWHLQWVTKYRYRVFSNSTLQKLCEIFLCEAAKRYRFEIEELEVASDHIHVIAKLRPSMSPSHAVQLMKGYTSRMLFKVEEDKLKAFYWRDIGIRSLWSDGKFIASVGHITLEKAKEYVQNHGAHGAEARIKNPRPLGLGRTSSSKLRKRGGSSEL